MTSTSSPSLSVTLNSWTDLFAAASASASSSEEDSATSSADPEPNAWKNWSWLPSNSSSSFIQIESLNEFLKVLHEFFYREEICLEEPVELS